MAGSPRPTVGPVLAEADELFGKWFHIGGDKGLNGVVERSAGFRHGEVHRVVTRVLNVHSDADDHGVAPDPVRLPRQPRSPAGARPTRHGELGIWFRSPAVDVFATLGPPGTNVGRWAVSITDEVMELFEGTGGGPVQNRSVWPSIRPRLRYWVRRPALRTPSCFPPCCGGWISGTGWLCGRGSAWCSTISGSSTGRRVKPARSIVWRAVM